MSKTIHVQKVREMANSMLANKNLSDDERKGAAQLLEKILFETDNYHGYGFDEWLNHDGYYKWVGAGEPADVTPYLGNQTMRIYF